MKKLYLVSDIHIISFTAGEPTDIQDLFAVREMLHILDIRYTFS